MTGVALKASRWIYELTLLAYPPELRRRFGAEMAEVFVGQLTDAQERKSIRCVARVWWDAYAEILSVALPGQAMNPALVVPLASLLSTTAVFASLNWALENPLRLNSMYHAFVRNFSP